jgi:hypothetical protein
MTVLRRDRSQSMSAHDASHVLGAVASIVGVVLVVNAAWSRPATVS